MGKKDGGGKKGGMPGMSAGGPLGALSGGNTPQDWGQGIQNAPFEQYHTGMGTQAGGDPYAGSRFNMGQQGQIYNEYGQNYTPYDARGNAMTQSPLGMDQMSPGVAEQWQQQNQSRFLQPGAAGDYWQQVQGQYGPGGPGTSNYAEQAYKDFQKPNISQDAGLDPYYKNAQNRLNENINSQASARGMFGSSGAMNQLTEGATGLAAEQANREADYNLRAQGERRAWEGLGGQLAGQADQSSRAGSQDALAWTQGLGQLAGNADQSELNRLMGGMNAASTAQQFGRQRARDYMGDLMGASGAMAGMAGNTYDDMFETDAGLMNNALMMENGLAQAALQASLHNQEKQKADATWAKGMMNGKGGGKKGG